MKKFLTALKYFFLALGLLFLEQLPTAFIAADQPFWQSALIILALLIVAALTVFVAKRVGLLNYLKDLKTWKAWKTILVGFVVLTIVKYIGGVVLLLENGIGANTENQAALEQLGMSPLLLVVLTAIAAPIVEETVMRGLILGRLFNNSYLGVILSSLLFGLLHIPTNIGSWIIYGGMGLVLAVVYHKTQKLEYTIAIHFINNALGVLFMIL
ncbi:CPBP family intramembrane glutamic endopeptidase [Streptococcus pasteurianus]|mgnify:FL=1|uniref:CPBP family intramembrane glutamic endopeptidase n=1 Tax=Streptococcus pasteurianus TaxID=197614 RepID=UPI0022E2EA84|nr:type II CAAX endopeptidase family protein [Streptococcus pasteurianus]